MRLCIAGMVLAAMLAATACERADRATPAAAATTRATPAAAADAPQSGQRAHALALAAMRDGRIYAPAGDSAIDHWLAAREQSPDDPAVAGAIVELQPYLLIACESAIARAQVDEARRLLALMSRSLPSAPALPRLRQAIAAAQAHAEARAEADARALAAREALLARDAQARAAASAATARAGAAMAPERDAAAPPAAAGIRAPAPPLPRPSSPALAAQAGSSSRTAMPTPTQVPPPAPTQSPSQRPAARPRAASSPVLVRAVPARYPAIALHRRIEGRVEVAFTVQPDGSVAGARVRFAQPEGVFERPALEAVARYRFAPAPQAHDTVQTIHFRLPDES